MIVVWFLIGIGGYTNYNDQSNLSESLISILGNGSVTLSFVKIQNVILRLIVDGLGMIAVLGEDSAVSVNNSVFSELETVGKGRDI